MLDYGELRDLRKERNALLDEAGAMEDKRITEKRDCFTAEEGTEFDAKMARVDALNKHIQRIEPLLELKGLMGEPTKPEPSASAGEIRAVYEEPYALGELCRDIAYAARNHAMPPKLAELRDLQIRATGMSEAVPADGGFLVQNQEQAGLKEKIYSVGEVARRCDLNPVGPNANSVTWNVEDETSRADGSRRGGIRAYWTGEAGAFTKSKPTFRKFKLDLDKITTLVYATDEELDDIPYLDSRLRTIIPEEINFKLEDGIINGSGAGMPQGIIGAGCTISIAKETGQAAATIVYENIIKMWARGYVRSRANAVWLANQDVEPQLDQLAMTVGTSGLEPRYIAYGPDGVLRIKGRPVLFVEYCATLGTVGDLILANLGDYQLIDKGGVKSASSIHVQFLTEETAFRWSYRVNGGSWWSSALTPKNGSNTVSPFVTLATRA